MAELDDGVEVRLKAGESMIQQGAWCALSNRGNAHVIAAVLGVEHHGFSDKPRTDPRLYSGYLLTVRVVANSAALALSARSERTSLCDPPPHRQVPNK